ncbi:MAG: DUF3427 domain-containing protein [Myxococcales bacterium]|nr:MAG: DUF3427 domain-containing protein [Myxococcales bacterium]
MTSRLADGLYEQVVTGALARDLNLLDTGRAAEIDALDSADAHGVLARHVAREVKRTLAGLPAEGRAAAQIAVVNRLLEELRTLANSGEEAGESQVEQPGRELRSIHGAVRYERPRTPLATSTLLTRNLKEPSLGGELAREVASSDRIDVLVAFITTSGIRLVRDALESFARRGTGALRLRVLTTVFNRITELAAVEMLAALPGAQVKVSYDTNRTRLHAKAWLFHRETGLHTAYIGSANLTSTALGSGQEWMVKACAADMPEVVEKFAGTFESLWNDSEFEQYVPGDAASRGRLQAALNKDATPETLLFFSLRPMPFQEEILDQLATQRSVHGRYRNLVVAATGTGKTVVAAFDYARQLGRSQVPPRLLFLAHRKELLDQARATFRQVLRDGAFGELLADGNEPERWNHVFATVQSAVSRDVLGRLGAEHFQFVVVDECHHAPAESYRALVPRLQPHILLGLTATPERADGKSLLPDFDDHIAAELRLWHALDRQLLVPFEYYGIADNTDLTRVRWTRSGYDATGLDKVYTGNHARIELILGQLQRRVSDPTSIRGIAFCVSIEHAEYVARELTKRGLPAAVVHGETPAAERLDAPRRLREREINVICTCDLYNEGVDLPYVDTLLFLRPTQSATLFIQQLGRGLRLSPDKVSCLVLDFIGQHRTEFRFDAALAAITGIPRARLTKAVEDGFPLLPSGCALQLDSVARAQILGSLKQHLARKARIVEEVRELVAASAEPLRPLRLDHYLDQTGRDLEDVYDAGGWTTVRRAAGLLPEPANQQEDLLSERFRRILHVDEPTRLRAWLHALESPVLHVSDIERTRLTMLSLQLEPRGAVPTPEELLAPLRASASLTQELRELARVLEDRTALPDDVFPVTEWPLALHRHYTRFEIAAAVGYKRAGERGGVPQAGIFKVPNSQRELLFVTLDKSAKSFSPTTRYRDYAISPSLFHWETQSITSAHRESGRRYLDSPRNGWSFYLFVRTDPEAPYAFCGPAIYEKHEGDRPIAITWRMEHPLPAALYQRYATLSQG